MDLVKVCPIIDVLEGSLHSVDVEGIPLMVTLLDGEYIVASRICTHKTYDLTKGYYDDGYISCLLHNSVFDLSDEGEPMNAPATESIEMYEVVVQNDTIYIKI